MDTLNKFASFLSTDLSRLAPPELVGEIGQRFFWKFELDVDITYGDLFKLSPFISSLNLGQNDTIAALPTDLPSLQILNLGDNNTIEVLPNLSSLQILSLGENEKIGQLPDLPNLQTLDLGDNNKIGHLPDLPNLQKLYLGWNDKIVSLPTNLPNLLRP